MLTRLSGSVSAEWEAATLTRGVQLRAAAAVVVVAVALLLLLPANKC